MSNVWSYILCFGWLPLFLMGLLGLLLGWLLWGVLFGKKHEGDLTVEGEGALRAEADGLRARIQELEGRLSSQDTEVSDLRAQLATAGAGAAAGAAVATLADGGAADDESYALEWRNRYLAARVKYLEGRLAEAPKIIETPEGKGVDIDGDGEIDVTMAAATSYAAAQRRGPKKKKAPAKKKATAKKATTPKVLYTDGPTDGEPDDLKLIKGIGPKFEKDLNGKGIYYFRQIAAWKKKDVELVENIIDSIPGRIERDEWVPQAKGLAKGEAASKTRKKPGPKPGTKRGATNKDGTPRKKPGPKPTGAKKAEANPNDKYYEDVLKFDGKAKRNYVDNIVKYCGISLRSRDASLVACSDPEELDRIVKGFCVKKLDITDSDKAAELVQATCEEMKGTRFKNRVTFYYLLSKRARKLGVFA